MICKMRDKFMQIDKVENNYDIARIPCLMLISAEICIMSAVRKHPSNSYYGKIQTCSFDCSPIIQVLLCRSLCPNALGIPFFPLPHPPPRTDQGRQARQGTHLPDSKPRMDQPERKETGRTGQVGTLSLAKTNRDRGHCRYVLEC